MRVSTSADRVHLLASSRSTAVYADLWPRRTVSDGDACFPRARTVHKLGKLLEHPAFRRCSINLLWRIFGGLIFIQTGVDRFLNVFDITINGMVRKVVDLKLQQAAEKTSHSVKRSSPAINLLKIPVTVEIPFFTTMPVSHPC